MVPVPFMDQLIILVSGGVGEKNMLIPLWPHGKPVSISIEIKLPDNRNRLMREQSK
jgi:hypothetical protein